jgi:NADH dehydrogenase [ubiquinone] 1 alpha subcomplex assembly factor 7
MADHITPLESEIRRRIVESGPMPVSQFMELGLSHPDHGYYMTRDPFGRAGDFVTAPEISQIFGELIGLWAAEVWRLMGKPETLSLIELGPGRGTLMRDALRAAKAVPDFHKALQVDLVETSPILERHQRATLTDCGAAIKWHQSLRDVSAAPAIIIANEFFDALPVHQAVKMPDGWHERVVRLSDSRELAFGLAAEPLSNVEQMLPAVVRGAPCGAIYEWRADDIGLDLGRRAARGGAALVIDYGHAESGPGDTLQAVRGHQYCDPLAAPGATDLTAHVDFAALARSARRAGARAHGPIEQGAFLRHLGIDTRAAMLKRAATPDQARAVDAAVARLTDRSNTGMGAMFKAIAFSHPHLDALPGFDSFR